MDAVVQFIRNGFFLVKDLNLFADTFLYDNEVTLQYYDLPEPFNATTPLELLLSATQFFAFVSTSRSGWSLLMSSIGKYQRIQRLLPSASKPQSPTDHLIHASLLKEAKYALRSAFVGFNVLCIGIAFFWLTCNSLHAIEFIGGIPALIHALTVMEVCLLPLLLFMWQDFREQVHKSQRIKRLALKLQKEGTVSKGDLGLPSLEALTGWLPFWDSGVAPYASFDAEEEAKQMQSEKETLQGYLATYFADKNAKLEREAEGLEVQSRVVYFEGYREFVYLILNSIAFYGYMVSVLMYYYPAADKHPSWLRTMVGGYDSATADWHGNFSGDLAWTIEPIIILGSPMLIQSISASKKKIKAD